MIYTMGNIFKQAGQFKLWLLSFTTIFLNFSSRLALDKKGNIATILALTIVPMLLSVSLAIDFAISSNKKARLDAAIDSVGLHISQMTYT